MEAEVRRYRVIEAVGRGGFGTVYRAELVGPSGFKKQVALKVLNPDAPAAAGVAERLRDEARVLGMLRHRAIVQVDGLHLLGGRWTVVMEFIDGVDLRQLLAERGPLPPGIALEIVQEVAHALHYAYELSADHSVSESSLSGAHRKGAPAGALRLLHRDIKPGNIQLTPSGEVKILDFGVARANFADREAKTDSIYFGSLNYMSPERLDGVDDHKGDIYALGAVMYELVIGEPLGRSSASRERHDTRLREALGKLWETLPDEDLYRLIAECLLYDPDARPTARELERACRNLRPRFGGPWLSEWAEDAVPPVLAGRVPLPDDLSGATLVEQGGVSGGVTSDLLQAEDRAPAARPRRRAGLVTAVAGLSALLVVVGGGGGLAWWLWPAPAQVEAPVPAAASLDLLGEALQEAPPQEVAALSPPLVPEEAPAPALSAPPVAAPLAAAPPARPPAAPQVATPAAPPATAPTSAARTQAPPVSTPPPSTAAGEEPAAPPATPEAPGVTGEGQVRLLRASKTLQVSLVGAGGSRALGRVPAGTWTVRARFADGTVKDGPTVTVVDGGTVSVSCNEGLKSCVAL